MVVIYEVDLDNIDFSTEKTYLRFPSKDSLIAFYEKMNSLVEPEECSNDILSFCVDDTCYLFDTESRILVYPRDV